MRKSAALYLVMGLSLVVATSPALAEPGSLDTSFGGDGKVLTRFGSPDARARAIAIQPDGKVVVAGSTGGKVALARFDTDGTLDPAFGEDGKVTTDFAGSGSAVAIQADGKIVAGGGSVLSRYNTDGSLDTTFGGDGVVEDGVGDLALQADGKIVAGSGGVLARYNNDGSLDTTFGGDGVVEASVSHVAIQPDSRIVTVSNAVLTRYNANGTLDTTFGGDGTVYMGRDSAEYVFWSGDIAVQADGKIVAAGRAEDCSPFGCDTYNMLARFNNDGTSDATFGLEGRVYVGRPLPVAIAIGADGKIVTAGAFGNGRFSLTRRNTNGTLDATFAGDGTRYTRFTPYSGVLAAVAIQADGKIIAVGSAQGAYRWRFALARYLAT